MSSIERVGPATALSKYKRMFADPWNATPCGLPDDNVVPAHVAVLNSRMTLTRSGTTDAFIVRTHAQESNAFQYAPIASGVTTTGATNQEWDEYNSGPQYNGKVFKYRVLLQAMRARYVGTQDTIQGTYTVTIEPEGGALSTGTSVASYTTSNVNMFRKHGAITREMPTVMTKPFETTYQDSGSTYSCPRMYYIFEGLGSDAGSIEVEIRMFVEMIPAQSEWLPQAVHEAHPGHANSGMSTDERDHDGRTLLGKKPSISSYRPSRAAGTMGIRKIKFRKPTMKLRRAPTSRRLTAPRKRATGYGIKRRRPRLYRTSGFRFY